MFYLIKKESNEVKMVSEHPIEYDDKIFYVKEIKDNNFEGYKMKFENNILKKEKIVNDKVDMISKIDAAKTISELKDIIKDLI